MGFSRYLSIIVLFSVAIHGCASYNPDPSSESLFLVRVETEIENNVRVKAAVPSSEETKQIFGVDLYRHGVQPVWIEIENKSEEQIWFLPVGLDPMYFTPFEAAFVSHFQSSSTANEKMNLYFFERGQDTYIPAGSVREGYVFTNLDEGTKIFNVDLEGEDGQVAAFTFYISVPGIKVDHHKVDFNSLYPADTWQNFEDEEGLIEYLQKLPCCTANKKVLKPVTHST